MGVRPYDHDRDAHLVKMLVGQGVMEGLTTANKNFIWHPLIVAFWIAASLALNKYMGWIPDFSPGARITFLKPFMGFATVMVPILGVSEYVHRPIWTKLLRDTIGSPDLIAPNTFYKLDDRSTFLVYEHKDEVQGVIAVDGRHGGAVLGSILGANEKEVSEKGVLDKHFRKTTGRGGRTVQIRHFDVDHPLRRHGIGKALVVSALDAVFDQDPDCRVIAYVPGWAQGGGVLKSCGFRQFGCGAAAGMLGRQGTWYEIDRKTYAT